MEGIRKILHNRSLVVLVAVSIAFLWWSFDKLLKCPSCYLFVNTGDGLKNYFTSLYFIRYDKGFWFNGMNYPYGEHMVYTDNQPVWSVILKCIHGVFPLDNHIVGILNILIIASVFIGILCVYSLLRQWKVSGFYSALFAIPVALLSPQVMRINGHYSLSYVCYIPLFLLLFVWWAGRPASVKRAALLTACVIWISFTHLYFFMIAIIFIAAYLLVIWLGRRCRWTKELLSGALILLVSGLSVYLTIKLTDPVQDRPKKVYGLDVYTAKMEGTFLPWYEPAGSFWTEALGIKKPSIEGMSYVGIIGTILFLGILYHLIRRAVRVLRNKEARLIWAPGPHKLLSAAFVVWVFATGAFYALGGTKILDLIPVLGQFRSLGRLSWVFYYVYTCFVVYFLFTALKGKTGYRRVLHIGVLSVVALVWYWEAWQYFREQTAGIYHINTEFRGSKPYVDLLASGGWKAKDFQAILHLPLVNIGSEKLDIARGLWTLGRTYQCAYETGLPIIDSNMSRTSVSQSLTLTQMISDPSIPRRRLEKMDGRPILLLADINNLIPAEQRLIGLAEPIGQVDEIHVYRLPVEVFTAGDTTPEAKHAEVIYRASEDTLVAKSEESFLTYTHHGPAQELALNYWVRINAKSPGFPPVRREVFAADGAMIHEEILSQHSYDVWNVNGDWVEVIWEFDLSDATTAQFTILSPEAVLKDVRLVQ